LFLSLLPLLDEVDPPQVRPMGFITLDYLEKTNLRTKTLYICLTESAKHLLGNCIFLAGALNALNFSLVFIISVVFNLQMLNI
jgi:hypothetical protein